MGRKAKLIVERYDEMMAEIEKYAKSDICKELVQDLIACGMVFKKEDKMDIGEKVKVKSEIYKDIFTGIYTICDIMVDTEGQTIYKLKELGSWVLETVIEKV